MNFVNMQERIYHYNGANTLNQEMSLLQPISRKGHPRFILAHNN